MGQVTIFLDLNHSRHKMVQDAVKAGSLQKKNVKKTKSLYLVTSTGVGNSAKFLFETAKVNA